MRPRAQQRTQLTTHSAFQTSDVSYNPALAECGSFLDSVTSDVKRAAHVANIFSLLDVRSCVEISCYETDELDCISLLLSTEHSPVPSYLMFTSKPVQYNALPLPPNLI